MNKNRTAQASGPFDCFFFQAEDGIRDGTVTGVQTCALPISWYVESLTTELEKRTFAILDKVASMGGTVKAIEEGWFQREISETAYQTVKKRATGEYPFVGVNQHAEPSRKENIEIHKVDPAVEKRQIERTQRVRRERDNAKVDALLGELAAQARDPSVNLMPVTIELARARATMGEMVARLKDVFGTYTETPVF